MLETNYINHIAFVLDESGSMYHIADETVKVADQQIAHLAQRSKELGQETRATIYTFNTEPRCVYYDKDVLRLPSLRGQYHPYAQTALIDATIRAIQDLQQTATLYGDHAFLIYVITDGAENSSRQTHIDLQRVLVSLPDNWTVAVLVPNQQGVFEAKRFGFPANNIAVWRTDAGGMEEVGEAIRTYTDSYFTMRASGVRGTKNLFTLTTDTLKTNQVAQALDVVNPLSYDFLPVTREAKIAEFVERMTGRPYVIGTAFYQLMKPETIQPQKKVCIRDRYSQHVYEGQQARSLLGLPDYEIKVSPKNHNQFDIFVQSTSVNRKLVPGTNLIVFH